MGEDDARELGELHPMLHGHHISNEDLRLAIAEEVSSEDHTIG